jgi:2-methylcitrate dehydratase PrpD
LNAQQMLDALGSAGTQAAGLWEFNADGAMSKHLHPGKAAFNGVLSADLAREGFTGATRILEGERGFFRAMSESHDPARVTDGLGKRWKILENCYKLHSCCGHIHTAIDAALDIRDQPCFAVDRVSKIDIETYGPGWEIVKEQNPRTPYQAKFSLAYCVAAALLEGAIGLDQFSPDRFSEPGVQRTGIATLIGRTRVKVAEDLTAKYPDAWPARLAVTLDDGTVLRHAADFPRGNPENPVPISVIEEKFVSLVGSRFDAETARRALEAVYSVETCGDMAEVFCDLLPA